MSTRRTPVHQGRVVDLGIEEAELPNGRTATLEVIRHPGGAAVAAVDAEGRVCLVRQWRHAAGGWIWELPAGKLDLGEDPKETARRELEEEAGLRAGDWEDLGSIWSTPGFCDEVIYLYLARDLVTVPTRHETHEVIEVHWVPFADALAQARTGEIRDAKTVVGLFRAADRVGCP